MLLLLCYCCCYSCYCCCCCWFMLLLLLLLLLFLQQLHLLLLLLVSDYVVAVIVVVFAAAELVHFREFLPYYPCNKLFKHLTLRISLFTVLPLIFFLFITLLFTNPIKINLDSSSRFDSFTVHNIFMMMQSNF